MAPFARGGRGRCRGRRAPARPALHETLESLYALADCLVLPTLHEGFGLPVLEAMARGVPVVCSDLPVLREVAGSAALYFDPRVPGKIAPTIAKLIGEAEARRAASRVRARACGRLQLAGGGRGDARKLSPGA